MRRFSSRARRGLSVALALATAVPAALLAQSENVYDRPLRSERSRSTDILHYRIQLRFDEPSRSLWGETTVVLRPLLDSLTRVELDAETFVVTGVRDHDGAPIDFEQADGTLAVHLAHAAGLADTLSLVVTYEASDMDVDPSRYGMSAGYDLGLDFKAPGEGNPRLINTLSFPEGARHWYPCYDHPNDRATQETIVTVPDTYRALSNGRLVSETADPSRGTRTFHWAQDQPHPTYLSMLAAGPFVVLEDSLDALPLHYWVYPEAVADAPRSFRKTGEIVRFFEHTYGVPFPWAKYDQVTVPGISGGAESTSATILGQSTIHDEMADKDFPSHWLIAHEAAHQWWGNLISYRDWGHTWVSESFATYSEYLFQRHDLGDDEGAANLLAKKNDYLNESRTRYRRPIVFHRWATPNQNFDRHTYQKGAAVLHMLRRILGDGPFFRTLNYFLLRNAFRPVDTHDFQIAVKEAAGRDLDWFFDQWLLRPGHPTFEVRSTWSAGRLTLRIDQVQDTTDGTPIYRLPIDVGIVEAAGKRVETVWVDEPTEVFEFEVASPPLLVRFDEGNWLLKEWTFPKSPEELIYQVRYDDVVGRMWAAEQLGALKDAAATGALLAAATSDPFRGVRQAAVEALSRRPPEDFRSVLSAVAESDAHSLVRRAAIRAMAASVPGEEAGLTAFFRARFDVEDSYLVQAALVEGIGRTGSEADLAFIDAVSRRSSPRNVLADAAARASERLRRP